MADCLKAPSARQAAAEGLCLAEGALSSQPSLNCFLMSCPILVMNDLLISQTDWNPAHEL